MAESVQQLSHINILEQKLGINKRRRDSWGSFISDGRNSAVPKSPDSPDRSSVPVATPAGDAGADTVGGAEECQNCAYMEDDVARMANEIGLLEQQRDRTHEERDADLSAAALAAAATQEERADLLQEVARLRKAADEAEHMQTQQQQQQQQQQQHTAAAAMPVGAEEEDATTRDGLMQQLQLANQSLQQQKDLIKQCISTSKVMAIELRDSKQTPDELRRLVPEAMGLCIAVESLLKRFHSKEEAMLDRLERRLV